MLDSGASHNFLDESFVKRCQLPVKNISPITVELADGRKCDTTQLVNIKELKLGAYNTSGISAQVINLQRYDAVLGKPWLFHANPHIDWRTNALTFHYGTKTIVVKTDATKISNLSSCNSVYISRQQFANAPADAELFAICLTNIDNKLSQQLGPEAQKMVKEFSDLFPEQLPNNLPPKRVIDHAIDVTPGVEPPFRSIYRLSYEETNELKKQLTDLLQKGFIRPSVSLFGALVLFVHKKEEILRLYVNYRALNKITIKNCYPLS